MITDVPPVVHKPRTLSDPHRAELYASGLTDETIEQSGIYSAENGDVSRLLGWVPGVYVWNGAMVFPYLHADGYARIKPDWPRTGEDGKQRKYEAPIKQPNRAYFGIQSVLPAGIRVVIVEGEKKCLAIQQAGFTCIGISGVWNWQSKRLRTDTGRAYGKRELIPDLAAIDWTGIVVIIVFDSDAASNPSVRLAECRLAETLAAAGATVRIARIPSDGDAKVGADDYLVAHGVEAFRKLLDNAKPAEKPPPPMPMEWARIYLDDRHSHADGSTLRWHRDEFYVWRGTHYVAVPDSDVQGSLLQWLDARGAKATPHLASDVRQCMASEVRIAHDIDPPAYLTHTTDDPRNWIALRNGILNLDDVLQGKPIKLRPHSPLWFSTFVLPYDYVPDAACPHWFKALDEILDGDEERVNLLGEWFGYCLTTDTSLHGILLVEGPPRSGKGTLLRALQATVGTDNCVNPRLTMLAESFGLQELIGKRCAICPDAHLGHGDKAMAVLELLKLISGEDSIAVNRKHKPILSVRLRTRFTLAVNELPKFGDAAGALGPRVHILPTRNSFVGREDRSLEAKITDELPGVFRWALEGLVRLRRQGEFTRPAASREVEADFARLVSPVTAFLEDCCEVSPGVECPRDDLWTAWRTWCDTNGHLAGSREVFGSRLRVLIPTLDGAYKRQDGSRMYWYVGVRPRGFVSV